jgi:hypothetical protein
VGCKIPTEPLLRARAESFVTCDSSVLATCVRFRGSITQKYMTDALVTYLTLLLLFFSSSSSSSSSSLSFLNHAASFPSRPIFWSVFPFSFHFPSNHSLSHHYIPHCIWICVLKPCPYLLSPSRIISTNWQKLFLPPGSKTPLVTHVGSSPSVAWLILI